MPKVGMEDIRRSQVINGAKTCIMEKGLHSFSVKDIAKQAGVSTGVIYHYFKNKDDLLAQVLRHVFNKTHQAVMEKVDHLQEFRQKLEAYLTEISRVPTENGEFYRVFMNYIGLAPYHEEVHHITKRFIGNIQNYIEEIIGLGVRQGRVAPDKQQVLAPIVSSLAMGIAMQWTVNPQGFSLEEANRHWIQMVLRYVEE